MAELSDMRHHSVQWRKFRGKKKLAISQNVEKQRKYLCNVLYIMKFMIIKMSSKLYINMLLYKSLTNFTIKHENLKNIQDI